jgi:hypothetical protein
LYCQKMSLSPPPEETLGSPDSPIAMDDVVVGRKRPADDPEHRTEDDARPSPMKKSKTRTSSIPADDPSVTLNASQQTYYRESTRLFTPATPSDKSDGKKSPETVVEKEVPRNLTWEEAEAMSVEEFEAWGRTLDPKVRGKFSRSRSSTILFRADSYRLLLYGPSLLPCSCLQCFCITTILSGPLPSLPLTTTTLSRTSMLGFQY